ncbi:MAG: hypothetical protein JSW59_05380, partial [Phycisphaerales bacterium]
MATLKENAYATVRHCITHNRRMYLCAITSLSKNQFDFPIRACKLTGKPWAIRGQSRQRWSIQRAIGCGSKHSGEGIISPHGSAANVHHILQPASGICSGTIDDVENVVAGV